MKDQLYYTAYEQRYKAVYDAGVERWGHSPDDAELYTTLKKWVTDNHLEGKHVIEFACGEGAAGVILSELGCRYHGLDIAPSALERARARDKNGYIVEMEAAGFAVEHLIEMNESKSIRYAASIYVRNK